MNLVVLAFVRLYLIDLYFILIVYACFAPRKKKDRLFSHLAIGHPLDKDEPALQYRHRRPTRYRPCFLVHHVSCFALYYTWRYYLTTYIHISNSIHKDAPVLQYRCRRLAPLAVFLVLPCFLTHHLFYGNNIKTGFCTSSEMAEGE